MTLSIDLGHIKTILAHAAAVHDIYAPAESVDLARIASGGLVSSGKAMSVIAVPPTTRSTQS